MDPNDIASQASQSFQELCSEYDRTAAPIEFDFRAHCTAWSLRKDHFTHRVHRYPARLTPYIPLFFLSIREIATKGGQLLDPFAGCGTVLVEAPIHACHPMNAAGLEINPLARLIAKVKTTPVSRSAAIKAWHRVGRRYAADRRRTGLADFPNKGLWFTEPVERRLARLLRALSVVEDSDLHDFFLVAASSIVRQVALADPRVAVPVRLNPSRFSEPEMRQRVRAELKSRRNADVIGAFERTLLSNLQGLHSWSEAIGDSGHRARVVGTDARTFTLSPYIAGGRVSAPTARMVRDVDLVLTSPPYANAQRYTRALRLELFALGFTSGSKDESTLDKLQIGTERIGFTDRERYFVASGSARADQTVQQIRLTDPYRAAIVGKYVQDLRLVLKNCYSALKPGGHAVFVIGNNCVRGITVDNSEILGDLARAEGFSDRLRVKNRIPSRGLLTKRHPTAGVITHEHIAVLRKPGLRG